MAAVGGLVLRATRAPINATSALLGAASGAMRKAKVRTVSIADGLSGLEAVAPNADPKKVILYFHGGGHWLLNVHTYREFIARLSQTTGAVVVAVSYRKPPSVRFPEGLNDAFTAWNWATERDPAASVAVAGDSSGGNLAFALVVKLAQMEEKQPVACIGISPWLRLDLTNHPADLYGKFCVRLYLGGSKAVTTPSDPLVSPVNAPPEIVKRLPPILMHAGRNELTTNDVKEMQGVCQQQDMPVEVELYPAPHIFQVGVGFHQSTRDSLSKIDSFLQRHWKC